MPGCSFIRYCHCLRYTQPSANPRSALCQDVCQTHACLQLPSISMRSIHASALCMQSPPAGDSRTAKRRAAQLVLLFCSCYCRTGPKAAAAVICSVTLSRHACWPCYLAMLPRQQETLTASKCGQSACAGWKCHLVALACQQEQEASTVRSQHRTPVFFRLQSSASKKQNQAATAPE